MGGRKSVELSHINYTEVLKQCLAAVRNFAFQEIHFFDSDRRSRSHNLHASVRSVQVCLKLSIFIF